MKYLITYDLNKTDKDYQGLIAEIKKFPWAIICKSAWAIKSDKSAAELRDQLKAKIDSNDVLFVSDISSWAAWNLPNEVSNWLNN